MPIQRRTNLPEPEQVVASDREDDATAGRSNDLQGIRLDVYTFISNNPLCTRDEISRGLDMKTSTSTARVKELIDLGYVYEPLGVRKENRSSGVRARCLRVTDRIMAGHFNDRILVEVSLTIDCNGVYGAIARVIGGLHQTGKATTLKTRTLRIVAPPNASKARSTGNTKVSRVNRLELQLGSGQIVDADYKIVEVE